MRGPGAQWGYVRAFLTSRTGMALSGPQLRRLDDRLTERCRGMTPHQYLALLRSPSGAAELEALISAVVVNKTDLFRDEVQLTAFRDQVLPPLMDRVGRRPLRIWSAGCSTGEEVATLLMLLAEAGADPASTVLGTDISEAALRKARSLAFSPEQARRVPAGSRERYFAPLGSRLTLVMPLRARASFQVHNLMDAPYPMATGGEGFDVIFCRNVLIYFTQEAFLRTVASLAESLVPGGLLVLSASEPLLQVPATLRVFRTETAFFYQRVDVSPEPDLAVTSGAVRAPPARQSGRFATVVTPSTPAPREPVQGTAGVTSPSTSSRESSRFSVVGTPGPVETVSPSGSSRESGRFAALVAPSPPGARAPSGQVGRPGAPTPSSATPAPALGGEAPGRVPPEGTPSTEGASPSVPVRESGRFVAVDVSRVSASEGTEPAAFAEADLLFACVLDGAASGVSDAVAERDLRRCLALDPDHAAARYLLGLLLEQCRRPFEAVVEYRRGLQSLEAGRARPVPFFLNPVRLRVACAHAAGRLDALGGAR
ncbi:methyltransferase [Myxococcus sp. K15C18031901]|uniref:CheR family methyltransferase n=1 Tax=Myxococcus dinghuensis TaxID=2906761 RepID=UPI0020A81004|nr:CheR family methyltransferase [Myxococcus dinghuensis]MCP3099932.1 methyltransferase [Myxococcus dinghuensis]